MLRPATTHRVPRLSWPMWVVRRLIELVQNSLHKRAVSASLALKSQGTSLEISRLGSIRVNCRLLYLVGQLGLGGLERQLFCLIESMDRSRYRPVVAVGGSSPNDHYAPLIRALDVPV